MRRSTVFQNVQIGVEATPGTPVAATAKLIETYIAPRPVPALSAYRPEGSQFSTDIIRGKEYTEADIEGVISYTETPYLLSSLLANDGLTYKPDAWEAPDIDTLTIEVGNASFAEQIAYAVVTGLRFRFTKVEAALTGSLIGRKITEGHVLTGDIQPVSKAPVHPDTVDVSIGETVAGLAKVTDFLEAEVSIEGRFGPVFTLDAAQESFSGIVARAPELSAQLVIPHEDGAADYMEDLRASATRFCRIKAAQTIGLVTYSFQITFPFAFTENNRADKDDVYASTFTLQPIFDATFGSALEIVVVNS